MHETGFHHWAIFFGLSASCCAAGTGRNINPAMTGEIPTLSCYLDLLRRKENLFLVPNKRAIFLLLTSPVADDIVDVNDKSVNFKMAHRIRHLDGTKGSEQLAFIDDLHALGLNSTVMLPEVR